MTNRGQTTVWPNFPIKGGKKWGHSTFLTPPPRQLSTESEFVSCRLCFAKLRWFIWLIWFFWLVWFNQTNQKNQLVLYLTRYVSRNPFSFTDAYARPAWGQDGCSCEPLLFWACRISSPRL